MRPSPSTLPNRRPLPAHPSRRRTRCRPNRRPGRLKSNPLPPPRPEIPVAASQPRRTRTRSGPRLRDRPRPREAITGNRPIHAIRPYLIRPIRITRILTGLRRADGPSRHGAVVSCALIDGLLRPTRGCQACCRLRLTGPRPRLRGHRPMTAPTERCEQTGAVL